MTAIKDNKENGFGWARGGLPQMRVPGKVFPRSDMSAETEG